MADATVPEHRRLVTSRVAARVLSLSPRSIYNLRACGALPTVRIGGCVRIDLEDLEHLIASGKHDMTEGDLA